MGMLKALAVVMLAGGSVVWVVDRLPTDATSPAVRHWLELADVRTHARALWDVARGAVPGSGDLQYHGAFVMPATCQNTVQAVQMVGVTQLDAHRLQQEAPLLEDKPYNMAEGLALLRYVREAYQRARLPEPTLSLNLNAVCDGVVEVRVHEDRMVAPEPPEALFARVLADLEAAMHAPPVRAAKLGGVRSGEMREARAFQPRQRHAAHVGGGQLNDYPADTPLAYAPVAPLQPPPVQGGYGPQGPWADGKADTTAPAWEAPYASQPADDNLLFLAAWVNGRLAVDNFEASLTNIPSKAMVPLSVMVRALDFPIVVDVAAGRADGWFIDEKRTFVLDMAAGQVQVAGVKKALPTGAVERRADDIYIMSDLLAQWFPLDVRLDMAELRLVMVSHEDLPVDARRVREASWQNMEAAKALQAANEIKNAQPLPHRLWGAPTVRLDAHSNMQMPASSPVQTTGGLTVQTEGELLYGTGNITTNVQRNAEGEWAWSDMTVAVRRHALTPSLLGPLGATTLEAGDITAGSPGLSRGPNQGRGVRVHNRPFQRVDDPDRFVVEGEAPVGWDVEVYQNQALLAFQRVGSDGRYRFEALPLRVGLNVFRVVSYGPRGERRERFERYFLGQDMPNAGAWQYDTTVFQPNTKTVALGTQPTGADEPWRINQRLDYGLTNNLTLTLGGYGLGASGDTPEGFSAGVRASLKQAYVTADVLETTGGARTLATNVRGNLGAWGDARAGYRLNTGFDATDESIRDVYDAEWSNAIALGRVGMDTGVAYQLARAVQGGQSHTLRYRTGMSYRGFALTNELENVWDTTQWQGKGNTDLAFSAWGASWRGRVGYRTDSADWFERATLSGQGRLADRLTWDGTVGYAGGLAQTSSLALGLRYDVGLVAAGIRGTADSNDNYAVGLTLSTLLVPQQGLGYKVANPNYGTGLGRATVRVFIDDNANGVWDEGEQRLAGVMVRNRTRGTQHTTDQTGLAVVDNLPAYQPVRLALDEDTLPDIFLKGVKEYVVLVSHPGAYGVVDMPVALHGEVVGSLFAGDGSGTVRPVGNLMLQLVDAQGKVVDYAVTERDGFFAMAPVPLGSYTLRLRAGEDKVSGLAN